MSAPSKVVMPDGYDMELFVKGLAYYKVAVSAGVSKTVVVDGVLYRADPSLRRLLIQHRLVLGFVPVTYEGWLSTAQAPDAKPKPLDPEDKDGFQCAEGRELNTKTPIFCSLGWNHGALELKYSPTRDLAFPLHRPVTSWMFSIMGGIEALLAPPRPNAPPGFAGYPLSNTVLDPIAENGVAAGGVLLPLGVHEYIAEIAVAGSCYFPCGWADLNAFTTTNKVGVPYEGLGVAHANYRYILKKIAPVYWRNNVLKIDSYPPEDNGLITGVDPVAGLGRTYFYDRTPMKGTGRDTDLSLTVGAPQDTHMFKQVLTDAYRRPDAYSRIDPREFLGKFEHLAMDAGDIYLQPVKMKKENVVEGTSSTGLTVYPVSLAEHPSLKNKPARQNMYFYASFGYCAQWRKGPLWLSDSDTEFVVEGTWGAEHQPDSHVEGHYARNYLTAVKVAGTDAEPTLQRTWYDMSEWAHTWVASRGYNISNTRKKYVIGCPVYGSTMEHEEQDADYLQAIVPQPVYAGNGVFHDPLVHVVHRNFYFDSGVIRREVSNLQTVAEYGEYEHHYRLYSNVNPSDPNVPAVAHGYYHAGRFIRGVAKAWEEHMYRKPPKMRYIQELRDRSGVVIDTAHFNTEEDTYEAFELHPCAATGAVCVIKYTLDEVVVRVFFGAHCFTLPSSHVEVVKETTRKWPTEEQEIAPVYYGADSLLGKTSTVLELPSMPQSGTISWSWNPEYEPGHRPEVYSGNQSAIRKSVLPAIADFTAIDSLSAGNTDSVLYETVVESEPINVVSLVRRSCYVRGYKFTAGGHNMLLFAVFIPCTNTDSTADDFRVYHAAPGTDNIVSAVINVDTGSITPLKEVFGVADNVWPWVRTGAEGGVSAEPFRVYDVDGLVT